MTDIAKDRADWLVDAVACATQNRMFLRGEPECDEVACEAILMNGEKAIRVATEKLQDEIDRLRSILSKHAECETMINQELKDVRAKLAVFQEG